MHACVCVLKGLPIRLRNVHEGKRCHLSLENKAIEKEIQFNKVTQVTVMVENSHIDFRKSSIKRLNAIKITQNDRKSDLNQMVSSIDEYITSNRNQ